MIGEPIPFPTLLVPRDKIYRYLLDPTHPKGGPKAAFFHAFGFDKHPGSLGVALLTHGRAHPVADVEPTLYGLKVVIEGRLETPDRRDPTIRSVWQGQATGTGTLITAYPI